MQTLVDEGFDPLDYRYFLLGGHYRSQLQFSMESLEGAKNARKSLVDKVRALAAKCGASTAADTEKTSLYIEDFNKAIEDDLNTPRALAELWGLLKEGAAEAETLAGVFEMDKVLGLGLQDAVKTAEKGENDAFSREIEELIAKRAEAKKAKDFALADNIRQNLKNRGIILEDGPAGTVWRVK
ncbi:cysteinyl-tRNA synthetase [Treponema sp. R8-4-B8]